MNHRTTRFLSIPVAALLLLPAATAHSLAAEYVAMEGVGPVHAAYDFRVGDANVAVSHLNLIHSMRDEPSMTREGEEPEIVVVFIGPAVNLISTEAGARTEIAETISAMAEQGVRFEVCMTTAHALDIPADSILPEVVQVGNGWISLIGYQQNDYSMIANF